MPVLSLRPACADDIAPVLRFWRSAAEDAHRPADTPEAVAAQLAHDPGALILAELGDELVGTVIAGWDGWRCHLYRLAVAPHRRRQGIGRALLAAAEQRFRSVGGTRADAMVLDDNVLARAAWQAGGYRPQPQWSRWVKRL